MSGVLLLCGGLESLTATPGTEMTLRDREISATGTWQRAAKADESPAAVPAGSRAFADGLRFGKYQVVRLLAIGGMSEVYEALHLGLEKRVALKVLRPDLARNREASQRFLAEGIHAAHIRHTNVVDVSDVGTVKGLPYLVMELLEGENLALMFERTHQLRSRELVDLLLPVVVAVAFGHSKGVLHRDLKPENIFLHHEGTRIIPKVLDFGVSRSTSRGRITVAGSVIGTPHYMAPEQARGEPTDARSDQYALGVMLYEGLTGRLPRDADNLLQILHAVAHDPFSPPSAHVELPGELEAVILRAMARDPEQRFRTAYDLATALIPFASENTRDFWAREIGRAAPGIEDGAFDRVSLPRASLLTEPLAETVVTPELAGDSAPVNTNCGPASVQAQGRRTASGTLSSGTMAWLFAVSVICCSGVVVWSMVRRATGHSNSARLMPKAEDPEFDVDLRVDPNDAMITLDGMPVSVGHYRARFPRNGNEHEFIITADGRISRSIRFQHTPPPEQITLASSKDLQPEPSVKPVLQEYDVVARGAPHKAVSTVHSHRAAPRRDTVAPFHAPTTDSSLIADHPASVDELPDAEPLQPRVRVIGGREPHVQLIDP